MFYVYEHIRLDTQTPFYVGKGTGKRAWYFLKRNSRHSHIRHKHGLRVNIVKHFNNENNAYRFEEQLIKSYKSLGYCEANFSDGGKAVSGWSHTDEAKRKVSLARRGKPTTLGTTLSEETKEKIRQARLGTKRPEGNKWGNHTEETKKRISGAMTGNKNPMFGRKRSHSKTVLKKMRGENHPFSKRVVDIETDIIYSSAGEVCREFGLKYPTLISKLNGKRKNNTNFRYLGDI